MNISLKSIGRTFTNMWRGKPYKEGGTWFYPIDGANTWREYDYLDAFNSIPEVNAVLNLKARAFSNGRPIIVNKKGREVESASNKTILQNPNWFQSQKEFMRQTKLFHDLYGNEYMYILYPLGFRPSSERIKGLFTIPPNLVCPEIELDGLFFHHSEAPNIKYVLDYDGRKTDIDPEAVIHLNDNRVNICKINDKHMLRGESKMLALTPAVNNIRMAYETRGIILKHRGALGILSNDSKDVAGSIPLKKGEKEEIQEEYRRVYGGLSHQSQIIISSSNLKWQQMSVNPDKLGLFQETEEDFNKIMDSYGTPPDLFVRTKGATYENQTRAEKRLYESTIIPEANEWVYGLNSKLMEDDRNKIIMDYSHLPIFQEDIKVRAEAVQATVTYLSALLQDNQISNEEYRAELFKVGIGNGKPLSNNDLNTNEDEQEEQTDPTTEDTEQ